MNRPVLLPVACAALFFAFPLHAVDWPTTQNELFSSFGQNSVGRPSVGMRFSGADSVRAADAGEIIFAASAGAEGGRGTAFPYPLGDWLALDHGNGIVSVYGNLEPFRETEASKTIVEKGAVVGRSGSTGWAENQGVFFSIYDRIEKRWVNPTMIASPRTDTRPPSIKSVTLVGRDGLSIALIPNRLVRQGVYRVIVEASDSENASKQNDLTPQRLVCLVNGTEQGSLHLETIKTINGELTVSRMKSTPAALSYLNSGAFDLGDIRVSRGRTTIEVIARDAAGNDKTLAFSIAVE